MMVSVCLDKSRFLYTWMYYLDRNVQERVGEEGFGASKINALLQHCYVARTIYRTAKKYSSHST